MPGRAVAGGGAGAAFSAGPVRSGGVSSRGPSRSTARSSGDCRRCGGSWHRGSPALLLSGQRSCACDQQQRQAKQRDDGVLHQFVSLPDAPSNKNWTGTSRGLMRRRRAPRISAPLRGFGAAIRPVPQGCALGYHSAPLRGSKGRGLPTSRDFLVRLFRSSRALGLGRGVEAIVDCPRGAELHANEARRLVEHLDRHLVGLRSLPERRIS